MTLIIGKRSNLSSEIAKQFSDSVLVSSSDIENNLDSILELSKDKTINIILNNFQPSIYLNSNKNFETYIRKSILNTSSILSCLIENNIKIKKLIYTSSSSAYGNNKFCSEEDQVKPMNLQGALKVSNEELIKRICTEYKINYTIARVFNMYGGNDKFSVISKIKGCYLNKEPINIINDGKAIRDYIYIDDVVHIYKQLIDKVENMPRVLNIATGNGRRVIDFLTALDNRGIKLETKNIQRDEINASIADVTLLNEIIDVCTFTDVEDYLFDGLDK